MNQNRVLDSTIKKSIDGSVLCWLATASKVGMPNVSPKEIFTYTSEDAIIIANIASPQSIRNIKENEQVCVSFLDILVQKGYQVKGTASIVVKTDDEFAQLAESLEVLTEGIFPFDSIIKIKTDRIKAIIAPRYMFFPDTTEAYQIDSAKRIYKL